MMTKDIGIPVDPAAAWEWVRECLTQGTSLALLAAERLAATSFSARLLVPPDAEVLGDVFDDVGRSISAQAANQVAADFLQDLSTSEATTLLVEDELARRGARDIGTRISFIDDRILHWTAVDSPSGSLLMRRASSGYPMNALVCRGRPDALGLEHQRQLEELDLRVIVSAMRAVVVTVYDAEAFLALIL